MISRFFKQIKAIDNEKNVSILISAFNEEKVIRERIDNIAALDFDLNKLEVLVGSDCSFDDTNNILTECAQRYQWLKVKTFQERRGKAAVLNDLAKLAKNEILLFTDANTIFDKNAVKSIISLFNSECIGGVSGRLKLEEFSKNKIESFGETLYWKYETMIKNAEGRCGILVGANGAIFAIRKSMFKEIPIQQPVTDDLYLTLAVIEKDKKFLYTLNAIGIEKTTTKLSDEYKRKVRFASTNFQTIKFFPKLIFKPGLISFSILSHKLIRWFMPFILFLVFVLNIFIYSKSRLLEWSLLIQLLFYFSGLVGYLISLFEADYPILSIIYYFLLSNFALLEGFLRYIRGKHSGIWKSTPR